MADVDNDPDTALPAEQTLDTSADESPADDVSPVWAVDEEESGSRRDNSVAASSSEDCSPQWAVDKHEHDFWILPAAIDAARPTSLPVPIGPDRWIGPAALAAPRQTSRLVRVGTRAVFVVALVAIGLAVMPRPWLIEASRVARSEAVKAFEKRATPSIDQSAATPAVRATVTPAQQSATVDRQIATIDRPNVMPARDDRPAVAPPPSPVKAQPSGTATRPSSPSTTSSTRVAATRRPTTSSRSSAVRAAAAPSRSKPDVAGPVRPAAITSTRTTPVTKTTDAAPTREPGSIATVGPPAASATISPAATTGVPLAVSPTPRVAESTPVSPSAPPAASPSAATVNTPAASATAANESAVRNALGRYVSAYRRLNVSEAKAIWPSVDTKALGRAFAGLESQQIYFRDCQVSVAITTARAHCVGTAEFVPKVGNRTGHLESREWMFEMKKTGEQWTIAHLDVH